MYKEDSNMATKHAAKSMREQPSRRQVSSCTAVGSVRAGCFDVCDPDVFQCATLTSIFLGLLGAGHESIKGREAGHG